MSETSSLVRVCAIDDVDVGDMLLVELDGHPPFAVYRVDDEEFYCTQDLCTHGEASLSEDGDLEGYIVECSWHDGKFDIRTGAPCALPCTEPLKVFAVSLDSGDVFIDIN